MFFDQFRKICIERNTTPTAVVKKIGLSSSKVTAWKNGTIPKMNIVQQLAQELSVPVSSFFETETQPIAQLDPDEEELLETYRQLVRSGKRQLMGKAYELLDSQSTSATGGETAPPDLDMVTTIMDRRVKK